MSIPFSPFLIFQHQIKAKEKNPFRSNIYETLHEFLLSAAGKELLRFSDLGFSEFCKFEFAANFAAAHSSSSITFGTFAQDEFDEFIFWGVIGKLCLRLRLFGDVSIWRVFFAAFWEFESSLWSRWLPFPVDAGIVTP